MTAPQSSDAEAFRALVGEKLGFRLESDRLPALSDTMLSRMRALRESNVSSYLHRLSRSRDELASVAAMLSVGETYFFRNPQQIAALRDALRAEASRGRRGFRLLSAGCASGEEAYTLAMTLAQTLPGPTPLEHSIVGVDVSPDAIELARKAVYRAWSLRETSPHIRDTYFVVQDDRYVLTNTIRDMVRFEQINLADEDEGSWPAESFDVVFCRNVLMYMTPAVVRRVVARLARALVPGGLLFLGHAENLRGVSTDFHLRHTHGTFYYERCAVLGERAALHAPSLATGKSKDDASWYEAIGRSSERIAQISGDLQRRAAPVLPSPPLLEAREPDVRPALDLMRRDRFTEALQALAGEPSEPEVLLLRAVLLVNAGELSDAERVCLDLFAHDELNAGAYYVAGLCREARGDVAGAVEHNQIAAYLDPEFAMPHLHLGRLARRGGDMPAARRELQLAVDLMAKESEARVVLFGGGFGRDALIRSCLGELGLVGDRP